MSMKKTDLEKRLAKKLDGQLKSGRVPTRFGQGSAAAAAKTELKPRNTAPKWVPVACRLPAELAHRLRDHALAHEGGMNAVMAQAVALWLESAAEGPSPSPAA